MTNRLTPPPFFQSLIKPFVCVFGVCVCVCVCVYVCARGLMGKSGGVWASFKWNLSSILESIYITFDEKRHDASRGSIPHKS